MNFWQFWAKGTHFSSKVSQQLQMLGSWYLVCSFRRWSHIVGFKFRSSAPLLLVYRLSDFFYNFGLLIFGLAGVCWVSISSQFSCLNLELPLPNQNMYGIQRHTSRYKKIAYTIATFEICSCLKEMFYRIQGTVWLQKLIKEDLGKCKCHSTATDFKKTLQIDPPGVSRVFRIPKWPTPTRWTPFVKKPGRPLTTCRRKVISELEEILYRFGGDLAQDRGNGVYL